MATIKVRVNGEIATNLTPEVRLVCQNDKYDVEFEFDDSWANSNFKTALFIYNGQLIAIPFDGNVCKIPALFDTQLLHIGVKSDDVEGLHTTTPAKVVYLLSANDLTSNKIPEPSKDVYDEIIALINKYIGQGGGGGSSGGGLTEEQVREIVAEENADLQTKTDENLETESKEIVGAINEIKGLAETARMVFGETEGTAYEGNKGKANADNIAGLQEMVNSFNADLADLTGKVDLMQPKSDETLPTESKEIVGAIKELYERKDKQGLTEEQVKEIVQETAVTQERDPTVPDWAKQDEKPTYTAQEVGALPSDTQLVEQIDASVDEQTLSITIDLKDKNGEVVSTKTIVLPVRTPDLAEYVKFTDYATTKKAGVVKQSTNHNYFGITVTTGSEGGVIGINSANKTWIDVKSGNSPITPINMDYALKVCLTTNTETLTDEEKASALAWLGAVGQNQIATPQEAGLILLSGNYGFGLTKSGTPNATKVFTTIDEVLNNTNTGVFVSSGTLKNVIAELRAEIAALKG